MLVKTRGIVLKFIKYKETSIIANIYTESLGLQGYIVNGVRSSRSKRNQIALYQPLTLLDMVVYFREEKQLHRLSEVKCNNPFISIPLNPKKSAIALFLVEVLGKTLKEQTENLKLFNFIWDSLIQFDRSETASENFHLVFMVKLARYLGFAPASSREIFGEIQNQVDPQWLNGPESYQMDELLVSNFDKSPTLTNSQRGHLLEMLLALYQVHVEPFGTVKSLKVLNQVFK